MFKIESYVTPILLSYVDKYVRDFNPADAQVSLWGGGVALHNLVLKADVLQHEVALPFTLVSGRIHELLIQVPWTKIMSEPIVVTIDTIECVLSINQPASPEDTPPPDTSRKTQMVEAPPGYMRALVRRIVSNITLRVHHLIVKYVQDDIVMSLNVKHLAVESTGADWEPAFADIDQSLPVIRRLVRLDDLTLCLDKADSDGKIRFYQEPLLYRCQLDLRVLTRLVSANTRCASSLSVQLRSSKLAFGVTNDQLVLLVRLLQEKAVLAAKQPPPPPKLTVVLPPSHEASANSAEPARSDSWSEWAWSWLPSWSEREGGPEEAAAPATPTPLFFTAYLDDISLVFKVMEIEVGNRKRARGVLELSATHAAAKTSMWSPTMLRVRVGARKLALRSHGKCVCGHVDYNAAQDEPTVFLQRTESDDMEEEWKWPEEDFGDKIDPCEAVDDQYRVTPENTNVIEGSNLAEPTLEELPAESQLEFQEENDKLFAKMAPLLYLEYSHDRSPPHAYTNPYENPPDDFQYSDWVEECMLKIKLEPIELHLSMGLIHRLSVLNNIIQELPPVIQPEPTMRVLTVEECEALNDNLPQRRIKIEARGVRVRVIPWDHSLHDRPSPPPLVLDIDLPKTCVVVSGPLYPHRVCSAAHQLPEGNNLIWQGARLHITAVLSAVQATICSPANAQQKPCARAEIKFIIHILLNKSYFSNMEHVHNSYSLKIKELNVCGSAPRLTAACQVPLSLISGEVSLPLKYTTLVKDALNDEEAVALDGTLENLCVRGYLTRNIITHTMTLQAAKATAFHEPRGTPLKQAWLFSGPDTPVPAPYIWIAVQWCTSAAAKSFDYFGVWTEPTAVSIDPLFIAWLAYKPVVRPYESSTALLSTTSARSMSTQYVLRRRPTPPSSSGRGVSRSGSGAELVHVRARSAASSSEPSERKESKLPRLSVGQQPEQWGFGKLVLRLHDRLRSMLLNMELGLVLVYVTMSSVPAVECATIREAMERHAALSQPVLTISLGRLSLNSNTSTKRIWQEIKPDGPTFLTSRFEKSKVATESFPWKMHLADISCYTLEAQVPPDKLGREKSVGALRSTLKLQHVAMPVTVLELVTTTITLSVVTKNIQVKIPVPKKEQKKKVDVEEERVSYFKTGMGTFKPSTLQEFIRGPFRKKKKSPEPEAKQAQPSAPDHSVVDGPVVSLGFHVHADTPPIIVRMDHDQVHVVAAAVHCFSHIQALLKRKPLVIPKYGFSTSSHRSLIRSVSEFEEILSQSEDNTSENPSDLIPIYEARSAQDSSAHLKTFFWLQWVVSRASLVVATDQVKLVFGIDDIITTIDLQTHYNQLKIKLTSASVNHYERLGNDAWTAGVLGGRVLEVREPANPQDESQFLSVTITQAQISNLPATWKEELHPKLLEEKSGVDSMWEVYATLAPLEVVVQPNVLKHMVVLINEMRPRSFCPLQTKDTDSPLIRQWPFCYVTAGGVRLLIASEEESTKHDDTLMFVIGKVTVNPHPENPIYRRSTNADAGWLQATGGLDGRQYEVLVNNVGLRSAQFRQLIYQETSEDMMNGTGGENPALKWTQTIMSPVITPILHPVDINCVLAPALYTPSGLLASGPALEVNLVSDCAVEFSVRQLALTHRLADEITAALTDSEGSSTEVLFDEPQHGVCPYAPFIMGQETDSMAAMYSEAALHETSSFFGRSLAADSGVDTSYPLKPKATEEGLRKSVSVAFADHMSDASENVEVFVTMGTIELTLYVADDGSPDIVMLRPPKDAAVTPMQDGATTPPPTAAQEDKWADEDTDNYCNKSLTDMSRAHAGGMEFALLQPARKIEDKLPLIHVTLHQPNLYYWRKKTQKSLQVSLFNALVSLGGCPAGGQWHSVLLSTARGVPDPITDVPPALATMKLTAPVIGLQSLPSTGVSGKRGTVQLEIERPVRLEVSNDKLRRLGGILTLIKETKEIKKLDNTESVSQDMSMLYKIRRDLLFHGMETVTVQTSQMSVCGSEGAVAWDGASLQIAAGARPDRLHARGLVTSLLMSSGPPGDRRHVVLQPLMMGVKMEASWEAWRRAEAGSATTEPMVRVGVDLDRATLDLRPADLAPLTRMHNIVKNILDKQEREPAAPSSSSKAASGVRAGLMAHSSQLSIDNQPSASFMEVSDTGEHYYKDDLRSGAFKIVSGDQLPMAYQVVLHNAAVSWRYPHPRAITRVVAFPLPNQDEEIDCVLELCMPLLARWEPHTYFKIPVGEPRELQLRMMPPVTAFAVMWRFRVCLDAERPPPPFEFDIGKFRPRTDPLVMDPPPETPECKDVGGVSAEQLWGVLRVDSYFAPRLLPRVRVLVNLAELEVFVHNSLPFLTSKATALEGYYLSKPLLRSHRVLSVTARNVTAHANFASPAGVVLRLHTTLSSDILDCATGTMEQFVKGFRAQFGVTLVPYFEPRARLTAGCVRLALHVPRLRTLHSLASDWQAAVDKYILESSSSSFVEPSAGGPHRSQLATSEAAAAAAAAALEGRVSLWVHNSCAIALRVGQEGTEEVVPLGPDARLAYRWRSPTDPKRLRLAIAGPSITWYISASVPFAAGYTKVRLEDAGCSSVPPGSSVHLHVHVREEGPRRHMLLSGRLVLANMLRHNLLYKVRTQSLETGQWHTLCSGELAAESVGGSVICGADCELVLKVKFIHDTGWSGDIPLKECPKGNVPWLVKVPCVGDLTYMSVWCRVTRARNDGRLLAALWPLYVLRSHLPLDTDALIVTESNPSATEVSPSPLVQTTEGRGACTHLITPGTTSARHTLSFQYRHIECPVTREAVPLHYGVTDTSVFDKRAPVNCVSEVTDALLDWLEHSGRDADVRWPYSVVVKHWSGAWKPANLQPRCDINVRYAAVRAGGGCSLEVQLCPRALLCNAATMTLTLRAHDAAPLCKLEPGTAISPPSIILEKPFFISVEVGRETFVSSQLEVCGGEPGRYGSPPPGQVAVDHAADFAIQCGQRVALLTLYYEIKHDINVLGISPTYVLINRLDEVLLVSPTVIPADSKHFVTLRPKVYKYVEPTKEGSIHGTPLDRLWLDTRWRGGSPSELSTYMCIAFPSENLPAHEPVPIELGSGPVRRSIGLLRADDKSVAVVVSQVRYESRWLVVVAPDPCPQFVVHNRTRAPLGVAQPALTSDEPSTSVTPVTRDCRGVRWWCATAAGARRHYSSPALAARYHPSADAEPHHAVPFITFAKCIDDDDPVWCPPVAVTDGEHLLQLHSGFTIKLRVRTYPHSTLLELQDVDQNDISASDIRRRLIGAFASQETPSSRKSPNELERNDAESKLLERSGTEAGLPGTASIIPQRRKDTVDISQHADIGNTDDLLDVDVETKKDPGGSNMLYMCDAPKNAENMYSRKDDSRSDLGYSDASYILQGVVEPDFEESGESWHDAERARCVVAGVQVELAASSDALPLLALHVDRSALLVLSDNKKTKLILSISDVQIDNVQYESGQYDFGVVASTRAVPLTPDRWPPLWNMFAERDAFATRQADARLLLKAQLEAWTVDDCKHSELTELEMRVGPLALYVEDAYVTALVQLSRLAVPAAAPDEAAAALAEERALRVPLRLRLLHVHPLDLTLTLHTAVRMYIALDQSPLLLSAFKLTDMMTSAERLTHALTVHYLSAAILGAGWVVGGLELLGAPGALAARVGGATGGVRGVASAAAAALLRSLSAWASSLARNLDLLAGDEEHARRAAAARRRPPPSFVAGLMAGITNFAINILGAVGGLAHHPLVGVAVGETESGATALRRGLLGALAKPLSATADLVAYAGHGLLRQAGWDPVPQPRGACTALEARGAAGWRRDCVRWSFRLAELTALAGFEVTLDGMAVQLLVSHKFLVVAELDTGRVVEMIDLRCCSVGPVRGNLIELYVTQRRPSKVTETRTDEDDEYQISAVAMARVARYTGAEGGPAGEERVLALRPRAPLAPSLHAALAAAVRHNSDAHFTVL